MLFFLSEKRDFEPLFSTQQGKLTWHHVNCGILCYLNLASMWMLPGRFMLEWKLDLASYGYPLQF